MKKMWLLTLALLSIWSSKTEGLQPFKATDQLPRYKMEIKGPIGVMTTSAGAPIEYKDATNSLNSPLIFNEYFMDSLTHITRERIPERVVHAKAAGASGYFEVTHDIKDICKAKLFSEVGKKTPIAARLSIVISERGGTDTSRDSRGFAVKFYTEEGNFDVAGFATPMYMYKDPLLFTMSTRAQKRNPSSNLRDVNMLWDFLTLKPESLFMFLLIFGDRGIPDGFRHMPGFIIHSYEVVNDQGEKHFIRFHFYPDAGIKHISTEQAKIIAGNDPDYGIRDLYEAIGNGKFPSWTLKIQVLSLEDVKNAGFDVFDVTKVLPIDKYPLRPVGRMVLNKNPINYFAEVEQIAFCPANLVPGILGAPDKLFESRRLAYRDAQYYRLGANFNKIPVNCPFQANAYNRDGRPPVQDNGRDSPNYYPNSYNGSEPYVDKTRPELIQIYQDDANNFRQATELYVNEMTKDERSRLVSNILDSLGGAEKFLQDRAVKLFTIIHPDLGSRIKQGLMTKSTVAEPSYSNEKDDDCED